MDQKPYGCHVSSAGGIDRAIDIAQELGINTIQIHPAAPQRWNSKPFAAGLEDEFIKKRKSSGVKHVFFHGIYLINLAQTDRQQFHLSKTSLLHHLDLNARLKGDGVIFHVGTAKHAANEEEAYARAAEGINWIMEHLEGEARLILEVAAGSGQIIGDRMEELAKIYEQVKEQAQVGFALDSQHLWASGYNLRENLEEIIAEAEKVFSLEKIWAIHLNDSKTELGSKKDRHENIGDGLIGLDAIRKFFTHPKLTKIPFILETPAMKDPELTKQELIKLRAML